jgi:Ala-tRNA(Pro) deacylase
MAIPQRIRDYLDSQGVAYEPIHHSQAFTAQEVAHSLHISGKKCVKAVVVDGDGKLMMAVIPASHRLSLHDFRGTVEVNRLEMLTESELVKLFPDCELGAIPPFGNLYGIEVWVDRAVADAEEMVFCAGTHEDCLRMRYSEFSKLVHPRLGRLSEVWAAKAA